jgi:hypothetical protein
LDPAQVLLKLTFLSTTINIQLSYCVPSFHLDFIIPLFSHCCYDLSTAFAICTSHDEIQARIVHETLCGAFHAFITFNISWPGDWELVDVDAVGAQNEYLEYWSYPFLTMKKILSWSAAPGWTLWRRFVQL